MQSGVAESRFPAPTNFAAFASTDVRLTWLPPLMPIIKRLDEARALCYKVSVKAIKPTIAVIESILVLPALLFMTALFLREVQPLAGTGLLVDWFSHHVVLGLYVFLVAMPLAALAAGSAIVLRSWRSDAEFRRAGQEMFETLRAHAASLVIAAATLTAGSILVIVAMHMITQ